MGTKRISDLTAAGTITGAETVPGVQSAATVKIAISQVRSYMLAGDQPWAGVHTFAQAPVFTDQAGSRTNLGLAAVASTGNASDLTAGTLPVARLPAFSGDISTSAGASAATLGTVNSNVGAFGSATQVGTFTINAKGLTTAAGNVTITPAWGSITAKPTTLAGYGITDAQGAFGNQAINTVYAGPASGGAAAPAFRALVAADIPSLSSTYQVVAAPITALAGVTPAANTFPYFTSGTAATTAAITAQGRGLLDDVTPADNRVTAGVDQRTAAGDAAYTILPTDRTVGIATAFTAPRTFTLPAANSINAGGTVTIVDEVGAVSSTNTLTVARAGSDTINGATTSVVFTRANRTITFVSDGSGKWTFDSQSRVLDTANTITASQIIAVPGAGGAFLQVQAEAAAAISAQRFSTTNVSAGFSVVRGRGTIASPAAIAANDDLGLIAFRGYDGATNRLGAQLTVTCVAASPSSTDLYSRVILTACASGSGTATELARFDHATGLSLYGTQVLAARQTGFAAATGTASKVTYATYTAGTAGVSYTASDTQGLMNHVQILSQQVKALKDALLAHGIIGA